jgi:hypothetical protein
VGRYVLAELTELELPALSVFLGVLRVLLGGAVELPESTLDHAQPRAFTLVADAELDQGRVEESATRISGLSRARLKQLGRSLFVAFARDS